MTLFSYRNMILIIPMMVWWIILVYAVFYARQKAIGYAWPGAVTRDKHTPSDPVRTSVPTPRTVEHKEESIIPASTWLSWGGGLIEPFDPIEQEIRDAPGRECKEAYKERIDETLRVRFVIGKSVMMDHYSIQEMCELLGNRRDKDVLEWGCGGSTLFFSHFARSWICFDHNAKFTHSISEYAENHGMSAQFGGSVRVELVDGLPNHQNINQEAAAHPEWYLDYTDGPELRYPGRKYDIILDDGVAREQCAESVLRNRLLKPEGVLVIHDFERKSYHSVLNRGWTLVRLINTDRRHLGVLQPTD